MKQYIPYTSYHGLASELTAQGDAVEFIQPWYTPISTTPSNTGMAVGGIGSTFTLTPTGATPNFSFIPGIFIDAEHSDIHFNDFYLSVSQPPSLASLTLSSLPALINHLRFYPAQFSGKPLVAASAEQALSVLRTALESGDFYQQNQAQFAKWQVAFAAHTKLALSRAPRALATQLLVALDFFDGIVFCPTTCNRRLTADCSNSIEAVRGDELEYRALYPLAEYQYHGLGALKLTRNVVSPLVKGQAKWCSLPLHWNEFELDNSSDEPLVITLVQPLANLIGSTYRKARDGVQDSACRLSQNPVDQRHQAVSLQSGEQAFYGVQMSSDSPYGADIEGEVVFGACAARSEFASGQVSCSLKPSLYTSQVAGQLAIALNTGRVNDTFAAGTYSGREALSALVCVRVELAARERLTLRFFQVMDHSKIALNGWHSEKAYAQYFSQAPRAQALLQCALDEHTQIAQAIIAQQQAFYAKAASAFPTPSAALKYATMAMNSLSFVTESSVWDVNNQLLVKECVDYPFFNSLDVYFYGSFSLLYLLPELDGVVMTAFAQAILAQDESVRRYWEYQDKPYAELSDDKYQGVRAVRGAVVHDLGSPYDIKPDAYCWHNVKEWKDLAPKFALMVYRHYQCCGDVDVVRECWIAVKESIAFLEAMIEEGESLPLTRGTDDTFDNLASHGISIYCGSLWVAGLRAAAKLAELMGEARLATHYQRRAQAALEELERSLWDEQNGYYHFFVTPIQAKHLTGQAIEPLVAAGIALTGNPGRDARCLNAWLTRAGETPEGKLAQRLARKQWLYHCSPQAFSAEYQTIISLDCDHSFGDALLADTYLKLLGEPGLFRDEAVRRTLEYLYHINFLRNSPTLGVANMTHADGRPLQAFQAQDVWIGVQFSTATALKSAGHVAQASHLMETVYDALYTSAKIPFAAPEGFNGSSVVGEQEMCDTLGISAQQAQTWFKCLKQAQLLLSDGRVAPDFAAKMTRFLSLVGEPIDGHSLKRLHTFLANTGLKYTAGRYFRPGMVFAYLY